MSAPTIGQEYRLDRARRAADVLYEHVVWRDDDDTGDAGQWRCNGCDWAQPFTDAGDDRVRALHPVNVLARLHIL